MKEFQITDNEAGQRFDKYLAKLLGNAPKSFFYKMLRKKNITLNGKKASGNEKLQTGDQIKLFLSDDTFAKFSQQQQTARAVTDLDILYEDSDILLINKPVGMLSQPDDTKEPSLVEYLIGYLLNNGSITEEGLRTFHPSVCNRLDKNTSGIVAAGKSLAGLQELSSLFHDRTIHKDYLCIVKGILTEKIKVKSVCHTKSEDTVTGHDRVFHRFRRNLCIDKNYVVYHKNNDNNNNDHFYIVPDLIPDFHNNSPLSVLLLIWLKTALAKVQGNICRTMWRAFR